MVKDLQGIVRYQNAAAVRLFGRCVGMAPEARMSPYDADSARKSDQRGYHKPVMYMQTAEVAGERATFQVVKHPFLDANGRVKGVVVTSCLVVALEPAHPQEVEHK